jgi:hypothetical protein
MYTVSDTNAPHHVLLLNCPSELVCAGALKDLIVFPQGLDANTFIQSCFMVTTSHLFSQPG